MFSTSVGKKIYYFRIFFSLFEEIFLSTKPWDNTQKTLPMSSAFISRISAKFCEMDCTSCRYIFFFINLLFISYLGEFNDIWFLKVDLQIFSHLFVDGMGDGLGKDRNICRWIYSRYWAIGKSPRRRSVLHFCATLTKCRAKHREVAGGWRVGQATFIEFARSNRSFAPKN